MIEFILIIALVNYTVLMSFRKWFVQMRYENSRFYITKAWAPRYCEFCLGFWLAALETIACNPDTFAYIAAPFAAAAITNRLLK